jgi:hypothetical protein
VVAMESCGIEPAIGFRMSAIPTEFDHIFRHQALTAAGSIPNLHSRTREERDRPNTGNWVIILMNTRSEEGSTAELVHP